MRSFLRSLFKGKSAADARIRHINLRRAELNQLSDNALRTIGRRARDLVEVIAVTAVVAARLLGLVMFDVQLQGALALASGKIAEMQTGEGKTLAAVPAVAWYAKQGGGGVHVMTVNDYLARRDAKWMGPIYEFLGLTVGCVQQGLTAEERQQAYGCDITYATANELGFDYLRDQLALYPSEQVHRPFGAAAIDEADSLLIDEARLPLVIAGGPPDEGSGVYHADMLVRHFRPQVHYVTDEYARNVVLTDAGIEAAEGAFRCGNLYAANNLGLLADVQNSLHAHALLRRDVDYLVKDGAIESVDEFKGRIVQDRRWPAGLHTAIEVKEGVRPKQQGRILGSITMQNLMGLYPHVCGMTGTAATQADEFREMYGLEVEVIPTNRPVIRVDEPDVVFAKAWQKEQAVVDEVRWVHLTGRPVLVGTASVEESERLSSRLLDIPHHVLNARNEEAEAGIIARAGEPGAVTISTNMAGRGTDIKLGPGVAELGGLYVIGTSRHESRRIDNQLRGRAGRQGDPGSSRFFVSLEDELVVKYGGEEPAEQRTPERLQKVAENQNLETCHFLHKYESVIEGQRQAIGRRRQDILTGAKPCGSELERLVSLATIDDLWSDHLAAVVELREGTPWVNWAGRDPLHEYLVGVHRLYRELEARITDEIPTRLADAEMRGVDPSQRGATWTYISQDQPFGSLGHRFLRGMVRKFRTRSFWG